MRQKGWLLIGRWAVWMSCFVLGACHLWEPVPLNKHPTQRRSLIGGQLDLRYPAIGALTDGGGPFCTGTLIASRVVLTAAHCVDSRTQGRLIFRIDLPSTTQPKGFTSYYYEFDNQFVAVHPLWTGKLSVEPDIAIGVLKKPVPSTIAEPIPFNTIPLDASWIGKKLIFLGYGLIQSVPTSISPDAKYGGEIPIVEIQNTLFLTYDKQVSTCHGDSGGPGLAEIGGRLRILGVNSFSTATVVPGSTPSRTRCDSRSGVARTDVSARFIQSWLDRFGDPPASCQTDAVCGHCERCDTGNSLCKRKSDLLLSRFCRPCRSEQDCGTGLVCHRFDEGYRCLQACPEDGCCPEGTRCSQMPQSIQQGWSCLPQAQQCPPVSCQTEQDCGPNETCTNGICAPTRPARAPTLCFPCEKNEDCAVNGQTGALCYGSPGNKTCTQICGQADFCPNGFSCQQPYRGVPKQCLPTDGICRIFCKDDQACPMGFLCQSNACARKEGGLQGDFCDPMPCKEGLSCVSTSLGKRCLQSCGSPVGSLGESCFSDGTCQGKALCQSVTDTVSLCIQPCTSSADCFGAPCQSGICRCKEDAECQGDTSCNLSSGIFPACVPNKDKKNCEQGRSCKALDAYRFCLAEQEGWVGLGQPCGIVNRCRAGLVCVVGKGGRRCLEDCTNTRSCRLGGLCSAEKDGVAVCICTPGTNCLIGRACTEAFYLDQFGYCAGGASSTRCFDSLECPPQMVCQQEVCIPSPPEVVPEISPEASSEAKEEEVFLERTSEPSIHESTTDAGDVERPFTPEPAIESVSKETPMGGCGCAASGRSESFSWWLLFLVGLSCYIFVNKHRPYATYHSD